MRTSRARCDLARPPFFKHNHRNGIVRTRAACYEHLPRSPSCQRRELHMYLRGRQRKGQTFKLQPFHGQRWWLTQEGWHHIARSSRQCATSLKLTKICAESRKNRRLVTSTEHRQACTLHTSCAAWGGETREASHNFICIKVLRPGLGHIPPICGRPFKDNLGSDTMQPPEARGRTEAVPKGPSKERSNLQAAAFSRPALVADTRRMASHSEVQQAMRHFT